jgi:hypothetical protein
MIKRRVIVGSVVSCANSLAGPGQASGQDPYTLGGPGKFGGPQSFPLAHAPGHERSKPCASSSFFTGRAAGDCRPDSGDELAHTLQTPTALKPTYKEDPCESASYPH